MQRNRLAAETSPYLLQHAENPVDWYPWGSEALSLAARENKPILLSIGYSACHWCHVMAHESFEDPATAALMNRLFVNIKVDREERPDLDKIYQIAQQLITQRPGGWPLTLFLTPADHHAFFGGTYFPNTARHGMPAFSDLLTRVAEYFKGHAEAIRHQNEQLASAFQSLSPQPAPADLTLDRTPLLEARRALEQAFDPRFGGFGARPKFPPVSSIERCLRQWHRTAGDAAPDLESLFMGTLTLTRMAEGGIYDHLGGGFSRYSVDEFWMIPHFEKMLYDNALLLGVYAEAALATDEALFKRAAGETADWLLRDMRSPEGGFFSSIDADSQGHEGRFYVWSRAEVQALLGARAYARFARRFGLEQPANFEGQWHLHVHESFETIAAADPPSTVSGVAADLEDSRAILLTARNLRVWPGRDEKILTAWNALTIKALSRAGRVLQRDDLLDAAAAGANFLHRALWRDGRLLATYKDGRAHLNAYLDDYAFLADALLDLLQSRWDGKHLEFAQHLVEVMLEQFTDADGGFYFTAADHERLVHRSKSFSDDSLPSGNAVAASVLCSMGYLLGEVRYIDAAERTLEAAWSSMLAHPRSHMSAANALDQLLGPPQILIIRGDAGDASRWAREVGRIYAPQRLIFAIPDDAQSLPAALADKSSRPGTVAYLCTAMTCSAPVENLSELARLLSSRIDESRINE